MYGREQKGQVSEVAKMFGTEFKAQEWFRTRAGEQHNNIIIRAFTVRQQQGEHSLRVPCYYYSQV
jgi:hypothetical protein